MSLSRGRTVGRYVILDLVGRGGMGEVYRGYDPELDRRVAIKVVRSASADRSTSQDRLLREARALARLHHPNVLSVYDVGTTETGVFFATEFVAGQSVAEWLEDQEPSWQEIVEVFSKVAQGLVAAHADGLVHRDVKPSNMMVADDGRVLVVDFGVASDATGAQGRTLDVEMLSTSRLAALSSEDTQDRAIAGTPAYMAPEQLEGHSSPLTDQFGFSVALYRALYGKSPFEPTSDRAEEKRSWTIGSPPPDIQLPAWLRETVTVGMAENPEDRHPSMAHLAEVLKRNPSRIRRRSLGLVAGLLVAIVVGFVIQRHLASNESLCSSGGERFAALWSPDLQQRLADRFGASSAAWSNDVWQGASREFTAYGQAWSAMHDLSCMATKQGQQTEELLDLRTDCLGQRLRELEATLDVLADGTDKTLYRAMDLVDGLTPIEVCADVRALRSPMAPPSSQAQRHQLDALRQRHAEIRALWSAGEYTKAEPATLDLLTAVQDFGFWPLTAEVLLQLGVLQDTRSESVAEATLERAVQAAAAGGHDRVMAQAFSRLVRVAGLTQQSYEDSVAYADQAESVLARLSRPEILAAELADFRGAAARHAGRFREAEAFHKQALEVGEDRLGPDHPSVAKTLLRLGSVYDDLNQQAQAIEYFERALSIFSERVGMSHPLIADTLTQLGTMSREKGEFATARTYHHQALEIRKRSYGDNQAAVGQSLSYLGELEAVAGRLDVSRQMFQESLAIMEEAFGPNHGQFAVVLANMAVALTEAEVDIEAVEPFERSRRIFEETLGPSHPQVALLSFNLGTVRLRLGRSEAAFDDYARSHKIWSQTFGTRHPLIADALTGMAEALLSMDRAAEALALLEEAVAIDRSDDRNSKLVADTQFGLARALHALGREPGRSRDLATSALEKYRANAQISRREINSVESWLLDPAL